MKWSVAAAKTSAVLSLLFLVLYSACNHLTARRSDVGELYFEWERFIPFVPLMIIPYMSIDLFFVAAPFLCDDKTRGILAKRITFAIISACACFLIFPLRFAFERPFVEGPLGLIFNNFRLLDLPFNEFPSLHIALRAILARFYFHHTREISRGMLRVWFSLIGLSTVLTYQHHVMDIVGGFVLGAACFHVVPAGEHQLPLRPNRQVGGYYAMSALVLIALATWFKPIGMLLLLPAVSLGIVAWAYFCAGPGVFRKTAGRLPITTWLLLWPVLIGQWISHAYYARECRPWDALTNNVWIGRRLSESQARDAIQQGVTAVLDLTGEFSEARAFRNSPRVTYLQMPIMDLTAPDLEQLQQAIAFIESHAQTGIVYVHCKIGYSRTGAVAGAYLLSKGICDSADDAFAKMRAVRPSMIIRPEAEACVREFASSIHRA